MHHWFVMLFSVVLSLSSASVAAAPQLPKAVEIHGVEFVQVPAGWFWFSTENPEWFKGKHQQRKYRDVKIWLDTYYIAKYEARATDFARYMNGGATPFAHQYQDGSKEGCAVRRSDGGDYVLVAPEQDLPATHLSWTLANDLAAWMGFRLPTETEWQKAARGSDKRTWPWGDEYPDDTFAGYARRSGCSAGSVTAFPKGQSPFGVFNMAGNAYEFVADWYNQDYLWGLQDGMRNPVPPTSGTTYLEETPKPVRVLKGGRWGDYPQDLTIHHRRLDEPGADGFVCYGVRYALDASAVADHLKQGTAKVIRE